MPVCSGASVSPPEAALLAPAPASSQHALADDVKLVDHPGSQAARIRHQHLTCLRPQRVDGF